MGKKNRFKKVSRDLAVGRKLEQSPTLTLELDEEAQLARFARNQWYRYFVQMEAKHRMVNTDEDIQAVRQEMFVGMPVGIERDSELGRMLDLDKEYEAQRKRIRRE